MMICGYDVSSVVINAVIEIGSSGVDLDEIEEKRHDAVSWEHVIYVEH